MANPGKSSNKSSGRSSNKANGNSTVKKNTPSVPDIGKTKKQSSNVASKPNQKKSSNHETNKIGNEISVAAKRQRTAIVFFAVALILLFIALIKGESAWLVMHNFSFRVFGMGMYFLPFIFGYLAIIYSGNKSIASVSANLIGCGSLIAVLDTLIHIFRFMGTFAEDGGKYLSSVPVSGQISAVWNIASPNKTGGVIGALLGGAISRFLGQTGAIIVLIILLIVVIMFITGMTLGGVATTVSKPVKKVGEIANERFEQSVERREARELERAENREKKKFNPPVSKPGKSIDIEKTDDFDDSFIRDESTYKIREKEKANQPPTLSDNPSNNNVTKPKDTIHIPVISMDNPAENSSALQNKAAVSSIEKVVHDSKSGKSKQNEEKTEESKITESVPPEIGYKKPPVDCLELRTSNGISNSIEDMNAVAEKLISTLESFGVKAQVVNICSGPSVTRYEIEPDIGVKIRKITELADDIALRLAASGVRISAIPNKSAIGIEVPNKKREMVSMRECVDTEMFRNASSKLNVALGKDIAGNIIYADLAKMPHLLIAGTTGSGKSVCLNTMIISILYNATPDEVKIVLIDPKQVEFSVYNGIGHLEVPVVSNPRKAAGALGWAVSEMEKRYRTFSENNVRDISGYNKLAAKTDGLAKMCQVVIFIDELSDLMMVAPNEVEDSICRLAQMARAAGMHLVVATQRPSVNVITGVIKANIPSRIALSVSSQVDSRTILDSAGAEKLLGNGDLLFAPVGTTKPQRIQGCFISDDEVETVVEFIKQNSKAEYNDDVMQEIENLAKASESAKKRGSSSEQESSDDSGISDDMMKALETFIKAGKASTTSLQNKLRWGYPKAARIMSELEDRGFIGTKDGSKERIVLISLQQLYEMNASDGVPSELPVKPDDVGVTDYGDILDYDEQELSAGEEDSDDIPFYDSEE